MLKNIPAPETIPSVCTHHISFFFLFLIYRVQPFFSLLFYFYFTYPFLHTFSFPTSSSFSPCLPFLLIHGIFLYTVFLCFPGPSSHLSLTSFSLFLYTVLYLIPQEVPLHCSSLSLLTNCQCKELHREMWISPKAALLKALYKLEGEEATEQYHVRNG